MRPRRLFALLPVAAGFVAASLATCPSTARAEDPSPPAADGPWTVVHVKAPAGASLCVSGEPVPAGVLDFRVGQYKYEVTAFGPGLPRTRTDLDATAAPAVIDLELPVPPSLEGAWSGIMSGQPATLEITAGPCGQTGCEFDPEQAEGLSGRLTGSIDGIASAWKLREFEWVAAGRVLACRALVIDPPVDVAPEAMPPDFALWLVMGEDGGFIGGAETYDQEDDDAWLFASDSDSTDVFADPEDGGAPERDHSISLAPVAR